MTLDEIGLKHGTDKASSHHDYCRIYDELFTPLRDLPIQLLEIGVQYGPSIRMWLEYFTKARIIGVDIESSASITDPRYTFCKGDQSSKAFWRSLPQTLCDIVLDDGSHYPKDVIASFEALWSRVKPGGFYIIEDTFTFYHPHWEKSGVGHSWLSGFIAIVNMHGKHFYGNPGTIPPNQPLSPIEKEIDYIRFSKGLAVIKKLQGAPNML